MEHVCNSYLHTFIYNCFVILFYIYMDFYLWIMKITIEIVTWLAVS